MSSTTSTTGSMSPRHSTAQLGRLAGRSATTSSAGRYVCSVSGLCLPAESFFAVNHPDRVARLFVTAPPLQRYKTTMVNGPLDTSPLSEEELQRLAGLLVGGSRAFTQWAREHFPGERGTCAGGACEGAC